MNLIVFSMKVPLRLWDYLLSPGPLCTRIHTHMLTHNALGTTHSPYTERVEFSIDYGLKVDLAKVTATEKGKRWLPSHI